MIPALRPGESPGRPLGKSPQQKDPPVEDPICSSFKEYKEVPEMVTL